jgi:hypothetical protein
VRREVEATRIVSQQAVTAEAGEAHGASGGGEHGLNKLGALLCWAVVFADIGTSVYYVPGILFNQFKPNGQLAGLFVTMTMLAFVLLALKYAEVSVRFPEGGGVVTVSARALSPWMGALGGMFILVDYFLTAAISSISGLQYFQNVLPSIAPFVLPATILVIVLLGILNWWGIKESAMVSLYIAIAAFISDIVVLIAVLVNVPLHTIFALIGSIFHGTQFTPVLLVTGFAGAFLAFSGLESISQLSPVMRRPRSKTVTIALSLVVITVGVTSPLLTILSTTLLDGQHTHLLAHPIAPAAIDGDHRVGLADLRQQHRHHRLLSRLPGALTYELLPGGGREARQVPRYAYRLDCAGNVHSDCHPDRGQRPDQYARRAVCIRPVGRLRADLRLARCASHPRARRRQAVLPARRRDGGRSSGERAADGRHRAAASRDG